MNEIISSKKELASLIRRNPRYVGDMVRGGFEMPCFLKDAVKWLKKHPYPTKFRKLKS